MWGRRQLLTFVLMVVCPSAIILSMAASKITSGSSASVIAPVMQSVVGETSAHSAREQLESRVAELEAELRAARAIISSGAAEAGTQRATGAPPEDGLVWPPFCPEELRGAKFPVTQFQWANIHRAELDYAKAGPNERQVLEDMRFYCDMIDSVGESTYTYPSPKMKADETGLVVGCLSGNNVAQSRSVAMRDTWLQHVGRHYIFTIHTDPSIPSVGLLDHYGPERFRGTMGYHLQRGTRSAVGEVSWWGLRYMFEHNPDAQWFWMSADDIWADVDQLMVELETRFENPKEIPYYVLPRINRQKLKDRWEYLRRIALNSYNDTWKWGREENIFAWTSGGFGILVSRAALKLIVDEMEAFRDQFPPPNLFDHGNDVETGALLTFLGVEPSFLDTDMRMLPMALEYHEKWVNNAPGVILSHYMWPMRAVSIEQFTFRRKVEALVRGGRWKKLLTVFDRFMSQHYDMLRRRMIDVRWVQEMTRKAPNPNDEVKTTTNWEDIPTLWPNMTITYGDGSANPEVEKAMGERLELIRRIVGYPSGPTDAQGLRGVRYPRPF